MGFCRQDLDKINTKQNREHHSADGKTYNIAYISQRSTMLGNRFHRVAHDFIFERIKNDKSYE